MKKGAESKPKYFIVLKKEEDSLVMATLPTSKDHIPSDVERRYGCVEIPERCVNVYVFLSKQEIAFTPESHTPWGFPMNTYIYGADLNTYPISSFENQLRLQQTEIELKAILTDDVFCDLIRCLKNSKMVKNKFRKML